MSKSRVRKGGYYKWGGGRQEIRLVIEKWGGGGAISFVCPRAPDTLATPLMEGSFCGQIVTVFKWSHEV